MRKNLLHSLYMLTSDHPKKTAAACLLISLSVHLAILTSLPTSAKPIDKTPVARTYLKEFFEKTAALAGQGSVEIAKKGTEDPFVQSALTLTNILAEEDPSIFETSIYHENTLAMPSSDPLERMNKALVNCTPLEPPAPQQEKNALGNLEDVELQTKADELLAGLPALLPPVSKAIEMGGFEIRGDESLEQIDLAQGTTPFIEQERNLCPVEQTLSMKSYHFPEKIEAVEKANCFAVTSEWAHNPDGEGYLFTLSLNAELGSLTPRLPQVFYFIIDRSNSVNKHRFTTFKKAVQKALGALKEGDKFNIVFVDKTVKKMSETGLNVSKKTIKDAEQFLIQQSHGSLFSSSNIYASLEKLLPENGDRSGLYTLILLTDGKSSYSKERDHHYIQTFSQKKGTKASLYTAAIGEKNELLILDLLSTSSNGSLLYSDTYASFPRKLVRLVDSLQAPLASDLSVHVLTHDNRAVAKILLNENTLEPLRLKKPLLLIGSAEKLEDFTILIEAKNGEKWLNLKQTISLNQGKENRTKVEKNYNDSCARLQYPLYINEGDLQALKKAKEQFKHSGNLIAFE